MIIIAAVALAGCDAMLMRKPQEEVAPAPPPPPPKKIEPSAAPILATDADVVFAQAALKELGYRVGAVDGLWGPRSANAIRQFENDHTLTSADGRLSELNLSVLDKLSQHDRATFKLEPKKRPKGISAQLDKSVPLKAAPQLIITERTYSVLAKANPYSRVVTTLPAGTGIYVISLQQGWYEIESVDRLRGFIRAN